MPIHLNIYLINPFHRHCMLCEDILTQLLPAVSSLHDNNWSYHKIDISPGNGIGDRINPKYLPWQSSIALFACINMLSWHSRYTKSTCQKHVIHRWIIFYTLYPQEVFFVTQHTYFVLAESKSEIGISIICGTYFMLQLKIPSHSMSFLYTV